MSTAAERELIRRRRCQTSIHSYALTIDIPTVPYRGMILDEEITGPARFLMAKHHAAILDVCQRTVNTPFGRGIIMAPPGSAKSTYASVVLPSWEMGRKPGSRIILTSYASKLAERISKRALQVCSSPIYRELWPARPIAVTEAASDWILSNESQFLASGLTAGITGNRASGAVIDDPVAGREQADSPADRQNVLDAYQDDLLTRLTPGAWLILIMTRWNEADLAGSILPEDYKGQSGMIRCRDGMDWEVLNIPAKAEHVDDPLGRASGEYVWPEYMPERHWKMFEEASGKEAARTWSSLYQQRPTPTGAGTFTREMIQLYGKGELPQYLNKIGASDYAVSAGKNDFTEHGCFGMDPAGNLWALDWWYKQCTTDIGLQSFIDMVKRHKAKVWYVEGGVIDKAIRPAANKMMREQRTYCDLRSLVSMADKLAKLQSFAALAGTGCVYFPRYAPWTERVIEQLLALPAGRHDDAADVCGLIGRAVDTIAPGRDTTVPRLKGIVPFTQAWLEWEEDAKAPVRYR
jgi:predicted phage terminase large subunit-like protein